MSRRGFSLLEVLIVAGVLLLIAGIAVTMRVSGQKQSVAIEFRAAALQSAQLVLTRLQRDVSSLVPGPLTATAAAPAPASAVAFTRVSDSSGPKGLPLDARDELMTEQVAWRFDPKTHQLSRNGEVIRGVTMHQVEFTYFPARPGDASPPYGDTLLVRLVFVPPEALANVGPGTQRAEFTTSFHAPQGTLDHVHEDWAGDR